MRSRNYQTTAGIPDHATWQKDAIMKLTGSLSLRPVHYEPPPQDNGLLPNERLLTAAVMTAATAWGGEADG
jgi:hypothetical protein